MDRSPGRVLRNITSPDVAVASPAKRDVFLLSRVPKEMILFFACLFVFARLRLVENNGYACSRCKWTEGCVGCFIRPTDDPCPIKAGDSVGVDWHVSVIEVGRYGVLPTMVLCDTCGRSWRSSKVFIKPLRRRDVTIVMVMKMSSDLGHAMNMQPRRITGAESSCPTYFVKRFASHGSVKEVQLSLLHVIGIDGVV